MDETMPIPVMTTRLMIASPRPWCRWSLLRCCCSRRGRSLLEQADPQILGAIDNLAVHGKPPVGDTEHQLRAHHALDVDVVHDLADVRQNLAGKLQFAEAERAAAPFATAPSQVEADHLPQRVEAETSGHDGIVLEMTAEEPEVGFHIELGPHQALAVLAAGLADVRNSVKHEHWRQRQLGISGAEQFAAGARQKILILITAATIQHARQPPKNPGPQGGFRAKKDPFSCEKCAFPARTRTDRDADASALVGSARSLSQARRLASAAATSAAFRPALAAPSCEKLASG